MDQPHAALPEECTSPWRLPHLVENAPSGLLLESEKLYSPQLRTARNDASIDSSLARSRFFVASGNSGQFVRSGAADEELHWMGESLQCQRMQSRCTSVHVWILKPGEFL